jgi:hypothetical protein
MVLIRSRNRNLNLSKVGIGTVVNSYGSATLNTSQSTTTLVEESDSNLDPKESVIKSNRSATLTAQQRHSPESSVADPGFLSRILIFTPPGYRILDLGSWISDPGSKNSNKIKG